MTSLIRRARLKVWYLFLGLCLAACGIDNYLYLYPVTSHLVESRYYGTFSLPSEQASLGDYFDTYRIFYRLYLSDYSGSGVVGYSEYALINSELLNDYTNLSKYFNTEDNAPNYIQSQFEGLGYYILEYGENLRPLSGDSIHGKTGVLDFNDGQGTLTINGSAYGLERSSSISLSSTFQPAGDRRLIKSADTAGVDVEANSKGETFAYVALYILAQGRDDNGSLAFSSPTLLGVFELP